MSTHRDLVIKTDNLTKTYGQVEALKGLDLQVPRNSIFGFLGPNGAGKTTTMKLLLGLIRPTLGSGTVFGHNIVDDSIAIRARIGYLPQQPRFMPDMTARETLRFAARFFYTGPGQAIEQRIDDMLDLVGLRDKADRPVKGFSGGERQRLGLAQAQVNEPDLLILDEPAAALDPIGRLDVLRIMEHLRQRTTIFYSTHILDDVQQVSDTVAILNHGVLVAQGPIEQLLAGSETPIYTISLRGNNIDDSLARVSSLPWVRDVDVVHRDGMSTWQVSVADERAAEAQLLRRVLDDPQVVVTAFQRKRYELEEIFVNIVEGDNHGRP
ncbi:MAG TPA: ABC transporter ATP-binding protein [Anaerolineae bacterium]|nr:ABC transporter ATP-binding protein [Anaerolineae bacterium]